MPLEREGASANNAAIARARLAAQRPGREEVRHDPAPSARRAEVALVSSYLRALRHLGEVRLTAPHPEMPH